MLHIYRDLKAIGDMDGIVRLWQDDAQDLIEAAGLVVDPHAAESMSRLCRALNDTAISVCQDKLRRLDGEDVPTPPDPVVSQAPSRPRSSKSSVPLMTAFEDYAAAQGLKPGVRDEWRHYIQRLIDFVGHDDAARLTTVQLMDWRDLLLTEPSRKGKPRDPVTVRDKYLTPVRACLGWAVEERKLPANVAVGVKVRVPKKVKLRERDFTEAEARSILAATLRPVSSRMTPTSVRARRWIPWLCAYTGARVNEFSQMRGEDINLIEGIWTMRITPEAGGVKNNEARVVPIHSHLIEQGFLEMVQSVGAGPLFYDPSRRRVHNDSNRHVKKVGERLAKWVRSEVGITDPAIKPNHGWRHTFKSLSYLVGIEERTIDFIQGHAPATTGRKYGGPPLKALAAAIAKVPRFEIEGP